MLTRTRRPASRGSRRRAPAKRTRKPAPRRGRLDEARAAFQGLEQRHYDLIGLALLAIAVYLAFVFYFGWNGGRVGGWTKTGLADVAGRVAYVVPIALAGLGVALIMRPSIRAPAALNAGGVLVVLSSPSPSPRERWASEPVTRSGTATSSPPSSASTAALWARGSTGPRRPSSSAWGPRSSRR